ncbi:hypothetical protein [Halalkalibacter alkalisediminis]|uniref:Uncharacterized protein n=1 Tax=Halalkalibacter alkalisediminis TaxID=935616 RepID=A0ABV6NA02_9BACI|nr:hypothetical protein [Halalkalibacter alkalisediminis]
MSVVAIIVTVLFVGIAGFRALLALGFRGTKYDGIISSALWIVGADI